MKAIIKLYSSLRKFLIFNDTIGKDIYYIYSGDLYLNRTDIGLDAMKGAIKSYYDNKAFDKIDYIHRVKSIDLYLNIDTSIDISLFITFMIAIESFILGIVSIIISVKGIEIRSYDMILNYSIIATSIFILSCVIALILPFILRSKKKSLQTYYFEYEKDIVKGKL